MRLTSWIDSLRHRLSHKATRRRRRTASGQAERLEDRTLLSATTLWATGSLISPSDEDPSRAVWDEFVGMWATCLLLPKEAAWMAAAFLCFRVLDIVKPWPIRRLARLPGGLGIMADDLLAGFYGAALLNGLRLLL